MNSKPEESRGFFPSVVGGDDNLVIYLANCGRSVLTIQNEQEVIGQAKRMASRRR